MDTPEPAPPSMSPPADPPPHIEPAPPSGNRAPKGPWLFWGSMAWMAGAFIAWMAAQISVLLVILFPYLSAHPGAKMNSDALADLMADANTVSLITIASIPFALAVLFLAVRARRWSVRDYFALHPFSWKQFGYGAAALVATLLGTEAISYFTNNASQPAFMEDMMESIRGGAGAWPLLLTAIVVAPIGEEMIFRGFLYRGLAASRLGIIGAIIVTAALWAAIHTQYNLFYVGVVFVLGLALGAVRAWSGSTFLTIVLHALVNAAAFAQAFLPAEA